MRVRGLHTINSSLFAVDIKYDLLDRSAWVSGI